MPDNLTIRQGSPETFWERVGGLIREDPKKLKAKAQNALAYSELLNISPGEAYKYHDDISRRVFGEKLTTPKLMYGLATLPVAAELGNNFLGVVLGMGIFQAISEVESAAVSLIKNEKYKAFKNREFSDFLPEDTSELTTSVVDIFEMLAKMVVARSAYIGLPKLGNKIARQIIETHKLPKELFIDGAKLKQELQTGNILPREELQVYKELGLAGSVVREAINRGLRIKVPAEKIITIADRPWFGKVKKTLRISPYEETRVFKKGKPTYELGPEKAEVPESFSATEEAEAFGGKATDEQVKLLAEKYLESRGKQAELRESDNLTGALEEAVRGQFFREAIEAKIGRGKVNQEGKTVEEVLGEVKKEEEKPLKEIEGEILGLDTIPQKKLEKIQPVIDILQKNYPEAASKVKGIFHRKISDRHGEAIGGNITLSTIDPSVLGHEIGEVLQPPPQFGRGKTIEGEEAKRRDDLSDAVAYVLMKDAGLKPGKKISPELEQEAKRLLSGKKPVLEKTDSGGKVEASEPAEVEVLLSHRISDIQQEILSDIKNPKTRIRLITGQRKISDLVREDVALKAAMKKAAREARHAFSVGKKEGYQKAKKHYLELREKYKQRLAQKAHVNNLVKKITQPIGNSVDYAYKEAIELLREGIDPHFRSKKKLRAIERTQDFFKRNPDKLNELSTKKLKEISKKPLNTYTIKDLENIASEIEKLKKLGRTKRKLKLAQRERVYNEKKEDILTSIGSLEGKDIETPEVLVDLTEKKPNLIQRYRAGSLRPARIFDKLDGGKDYSGPVHRVFYDEVNRKIDSSYRWIDKRKKVVKAKMEKLGLTPKSLTETRLIDEVEYSVDRLLDIYAGWKNPRKKLALMFGNNVTPEFVEKIGKVLTNNEKKFADFIIREYEKHYPRLREAFIDYANADMGYEPFYTPIRRADIIPRSFKSEIADELLVRNGLKKAYVPRSFTYKRKSIPFEYQRPLTLGLYATWLDQIPKQERFIALGQKVKELQRLISDQDIRESIRNNAGQQYLSEVEHYVNRIANPNFYKALTPIERVSQVLRRNTVTAYLAYNLLTVAKQLPSVLLYLPEAGPHHLIQAMIKMTKDPLKWYRFVRGRDPQIRFRKIEREMEELKLAKDVLAKVGRLGMRSIQLFDSIAVTTGWLAVYDRYVGELGELEAIRRAQNATHRTQPAASPKDLPSMYASNEVLNWMLQFTNQLNQIYNIASYDIPTNIKNKNFDKAFLSAVALAMVSLVIWSMSNRRLPKNKDDVKEALTDQALNAVPIVGREILSASKGWEPQGIPAIKALRSVGSLATNMSTEKKAQKILEGISVLYGIPYTGTKRVVESVKKKSPAELLGPRKERKTNKKRRRYE